MPPIGSIDEVNPADSRRAAASSGPRRVQDQPGLKLPGIRDSFPGHAARPAPLVSRQPARRVGDLPSSRNIVCGPPVIGNQKRKVRV
jgi:hypothetical protein